MTTTGKGETSKKKTHTHANEYTLFVPTALHHQCVKRATTLASPTVSTPTQRAPKEHTKKPTPISQQSPKHTSDQTNVIYPAFLVPPYPDESTVKQYSRQNTIKPDTNSRRAHAQSIILRGQYRPFKAPPPLPPYKSWVIGDYPTSALVPRTYKHTNAARKSNAKAHLL